VPILTMQSGGTAQDANGQTVQLPPAAALQMLGPVIPVAVTIEQSIAQQLLQQGTQVPAPVSGFGLIDTGASITCVDEAVAQSLGIAPIDVVTMHSASHTDVQCNVYPISFEIPSLGIGRNVPRAMAAALQAQGLVILIGRDALAACTFHYNGFTGVFELAI